MIRLVYSNRSEALAEALAEDLAALGRRSARSVFDKTHLVVPTRHIESYLKIGLARRLGIAANLDCHLLPDLLPDLLSGGRPPVRVLDLPALRGLVLSALAGPGAPGELAQVRDYIHGGHEGKGREDAEDLRRFQLATELSQVFLEYGYSRPDVIAAWKAGQSALHDTPFAGEERWQRALFGAIFGQGGLLEQRSRETGALWVSLPDLLERGSPLERVRLPDRVSFFGFSHVGGAFLRLFAALARRTEVCLYAINPCEEFWEDVPGPSGRGAQVLGGELDPFGLDREGDTPTLRLWGRPGRENVRLLNELTDCDFTPRFVDPLAAGPSLLRQIQSDTLRREPERRAPDPVFDFRDDESLRVLACPGVRREIEIVADEIWRLLSRDKSLSLGEIAVVINPREAGSYLPQIAAVFGECGDLPHNILDLPLSTPSRVIEATQLLLSLPFGAFGRQDLLRLCTHPAVLARFPDDSADDWVAWAGRLGIVHGADRDDHSETYITRDILNWEQGIRRLCLGAFLTGERSGDSRTFGVHGEPYLPEEHTQTSQLSAGRFALLVRSLTADARFARRERRPMREWVRFFHLLMKSYLGAAEGQEERDLLKCSEAIEAIDDGSTGEAQVSYRLAYQLAVSALNELSAKRGNYLGEGVVVSSLQQLRGLPFKVVFMTGLGEGRFPEAPRRNPLDLRAASRKAGDSSSREQDKYAFLETLLQTGSRLYLSYVARDPFTGEDLQPSSVVLDLLDILERGYLPRAELLSRFILRHPLRRYDPAYFPELSGEAPGRLSSVMPEARREAQALALGADLRARLGKGAELTDAVLARENPAARRRLAPGLRLFDLPAEGARGLAGPGAELRLSLGSLRRFLECPLQGYASYALGLGEGDDDALSVEDEPFATELPRATFHLRSWMTEALVLGNDPLALYERQMGLLEQRGKAPTGLFAEVERDAHRVFLRSWQREARALLGSGGARVLRFGAADEHDFAPRSEEPLTLDSVLPGDPPRPLRVQITGATSALLTARRGSLLFALRPLESGEEASVRQERTLLRAFLDHAILSASEKLAHGPHSAHVLYANSARSEVTFAAFAGGDEARAYLGALVVDLLSRAHGYRLPCEAVFQHRLSGGGREVSEFVERVSKTPHHSSTYGPIRRLDAFSPLPEAEARRVIERRFGPFFRRVDGG